MSLREKVVESIVSYWTKEQGMWVHMEVYKGEGMDTNCCFPSRRLGEFSWDWEMIGFLCSAMQEWCHYLLFSHWMKDKTRYSNAGHKNTFRTMLVNSQTKWKAKVSLFNNTNNCVFLGCMVPYKTWPWSTKELWVFHNDSFSSFK